MSGMAFLILINPKREFSIELILYKELMLFIQLLKIFKIVDFKGFG